MLKKRTLAALGLTAATLAAQPVAADQIALTFNNQDIAIIGTFVGIRDNAYIVETSAGQLHVPIAIVACQGEDCLDIVSPPQTATN